MDAQNLSTPIDKRTNAVELIGLIGGIVLAIITYYAMPSNAGDIALAAAKEGTVLNVEAMPIVAAVSILMGVWWMSEAIELPATALLPLILFSLFGVADFKSVGSSYASPIIFLFMGGFMLALTMQKWNLHTRIALMIVLFVGTSPRKLVAGFMIATGFLSMWVSNTATAVMMLPVGLSVLHLVAKLIKEQEADKIKATETMEDLEHMGEISKLSSQGGALNVVLHKGKDMVKEVQEKTSIYRTNFGISLMLGIAYSASIGSLGTIIGTPPNALLVGYMKEAHGITIGFGEWMLVGVPLAVILLAIAWALLVYVIFPPKIKEIPGGKQVIKQELDKLGCMKKPEWLVGIIFVTAALCWIFLGTLLKKYGIKIPRIDSIIAITASILLFAIPAHKEGDRLLDWDTAKKLPWDILLLFGGGLALSAQFSKTGLSLWIGHQVSMLGALPLILILFLVALLVIFLTEITSNTATSAAFLPVIGGVAVGLGYGGADILVFTIPVALSATCAFMLPVATPPNAIAYGSGYIKIADMIKVGLWLNIIGSVLITLITYFLATAAFGLLLG